MICPNCHNNNREGAKYCDECGFPLTGSIAETAQNADQLVDREDGANGRIAGTDQDDLAFAAALKESQAQAHDAHAAGEQEEDSTSPLAPVVLSSDGKKLVSADKAGVSLNDLPQVMDNAPQKTSEEEGAAVDAKLADTDESDEVAPSAEAAESAQDAAETSVIDAIASEDADEESESDLQATSILEEVADDAKDAEDSSDNASSSKSKLDPDITTDLAGLDIDATALIGERLSDFDYDAYKPTWRDGNTMQMPAIESDDAPKERRFVASSSIKQQGRVRKIVIGVIASLAVVCAIAAGVTYYLEIWGGKTVPDVTGLTQQEATQVLEQSGFTVRATQVRSDGDEGLVLIEDPVGNSRQAEGSEVVIHISVPRTIPAIVGLKQDEAQTLITEEGLTGVSFETERSDEEEGKVLSVSPEQGTRVRSNQTVVVKVATPFTVPDISNMTLSDAQQAIIDAGLTYGLYYTYTEDYPDYTVLGISPEAGTKVTGGSFVTINVSRARATELINATQSLLAAGSTITIGGVNYAVSSLDSVSYLGENKTSYTITGTPFITLLGENLYGTPRSVSGTITWNDDNTMSSIS